MKKSDALLIILQNIHKIYPKCREKISLDDFSKKEITEANTLLCELEKAGMSPHREMECGCCHDFEWEEE